MQDNYGDRMKQYEGVEASRKAIPLLPIMIRLDGRGFHSFCRDLEKPYDIRLSNLMKETTKFLVEQTNAKIGYTQSDEISLVLYSDDYDTQNFFDGKFQKLCSVVASLCTAFFNTNLPKYIPGKDVLAIFDCRVWNVPNKIEAANTILWREQDATKNSISMAARHYFSHDSLIGKSGQIMQDMLYMNCGINWNNYPEFFKRGTFIQRKHKEVEYSAEELNSLPCKHLARQNPKLKVKRSVIEEVEVPKFSSVTNRVGFIFDGEDIEVEPIF